jgi:hypothetical protein
VFDDDGTTKFLADIQVYLGDTAKDVSSPLFPDFAPHFANCRDMDLSDALIFSFHKTEGQRRENATRFAREALRRCATSPLGIERSLVVIDFVHGVMPEELSNNVWSKLFFRPTDEQDLANWVGDLALRWMEWNIEVSIGIDLAVNAIRVVEPLRFKNLIEYFRDQRWDAGDSLTRIANVAKRRLETDNAEFVAAEIDIVEIKDLLASFPTPTLPATTRETLDAFQSERHVLASDIAHWDSAESPWPNELELSVME